MLTTRLVGHRQYLIRQISTFSDDLFEDLPPLEVKSENFLDSEDPSEPRKQRYYIPPSVTDDELLQLTASKVSEWPKSRVVWALGRLGFLKKKIRVETNVEPVEALVGRLNDLVDQMNTRDIVRAMQGIAYGHVDSSFSPIINRLRKKFSVSIDSVNELFLVSFVYANLKLVNRNDWMLTTGCRSTLQFLLSEMVHRKHKILCANWLEICAALLRSKHSVREPLSDSIDLMVQHAFSFSLKHVKDAKILSMFAQSLVGYSSSLDFEAINNVLGSKFSKNWISGNDGIEIGFFFFANHLMSPGNMEKWLSAIRTAKQPFCTDSLENLIKLHFVHWRIVKENSFISEENRQWLSQINCLPETSDAAVVYSPVVTADSVHVNKVLVRVANAIVENESKFLGPFWCPVVLGNSKAVIEWEKPWEFEPPYRQAWSKCLMKLRREFLVENGWEIVQLKREDWLANSPAEKIAVNERFCGILREKLGEERVCWKEVDGHVVVDGEKLVPPTVVEIDENAIPRVRRESKRIENMLRAKRRTITKQVRQKIRKSLKT